MGPRDQRTKTACMAAVRGGRLVPEINQTIFVNGIQIVQAYTQYMDHQHKTINSIIHYVRDARGR